MIIHGNFLTNPTPAAGCSGVLVSMY